MGDAARIFLNNVDSMSPWLKDAQRPQPNLPNLTDNDWNGGAFIMSGDKL